jgi:hypothetical protein
MLVRAGAPFFRHQMPLLSTSIRTVEGRASFGGTRGMGRFSRSRGLGAVLNYCLNNPPDAATAAIITGRGDSIALVPCGGIPTPSGSEFPTGNQPNAPVGYGAPLAPPAWDGSYAGMENCAPLDSACVARNTAREIAAQNVFYGAGRNYQTSLCIANRGGGYVPAGTDIATWCENQYGGVPGAGGGGVTPPPVPMPPAPSPSGSGGTVPTTGNYRVTLRNLTTGNSSIFNVGDQWQISVSGAPPNSPVQNAATQSGHPASTSVVGTTDGSGNFVISGVMPAADVGTWTEQWSVAGIPFGLISFSVVSGAGGGGPGDSGGRVGPLGGGSPAGGGASVDVGGLLTAKSFLGMPNWVWLAGVGGLMFLGGKH